MEEETGLEVARPDNPLLVTPLGIALSCARRNRKKAVAAESHGGDKGSSKVKVRQRAK
jgi:hypothetical protein